MIKSKKFKIKFPKNKKIIYVLFVLVAFLLFGLTVNLVKDLKPEDETVDVFVRFNTVSCNNVVETFDTLKKECKKGESVRITLPEKNGYVAKSQDGTVLDNILTLTAKTDLSYTINYYCTADDIEYSLIDYPVDGDPGMCFAVCQCGVSWDYEFTSLTQTIYFGGDSINQISGYSSAVDGYLLPTSFKLVRLASHVPEFKIIEDGCVSVLNGNDLNPVITVELEYDESVWGENAISFKSNMNHSADSKYSISIGKNHRIIFALEDTTDVSNWLEWIKCKNCPLSVSPIKLIVTCDFSQ